MKDDAMKKLGPDDPLSHSTDPVAENIAQLKALFPELVTEGSEGVAVNVDVLKTLVGDATVTDTEEKYGLNWHGKRRARQLALTPSTGTLRPMPEDSVDWDTTQNLMIEGDNLEVLKLLQKSYAGKVKLIYVDPPYNTGKDMIYPDDYRDTLTNYLVMTGQADGNGKRLISNSDATGRFHTNWLNMLFPRLKVARTMLRDDGAFFISSDDHEVDNLRRICSEIFGEENLVAQFVWNTEGHTDNQFDVKINHEYILLYARDADQLTLGHVVDPNTREQSNLWKGFAENSITKNGAANPPSEIVLPVGFPCSVEQLDLLPNVPGPEFFSAVEKQGFISRDTTDRHKVTYPIRLDRVRVSSSLLKEKCRVFSGWANANKLRAFIANECHPIDDGGDKVSFYLSERGVVYYRRDRDRARNILSVLRNLGTTERMRSELEQMGIPFQYPKPKELLRYLVQIGCEGPGISMDFFAGSGTLAHAVWQQQVADGVSRRVVLVQLPEPLDPDDERHVPAIQLCDELNLPRNLAELTKERLRRTARKIQSENSNAQADFGFRVFKLASSNIRTWEPNRDDLATTLEDAVEHLKSDRTEQDVLYELLLKLGLDLCVPIEARSLAGKTVHSIGGGVLIACLAEKIAQQEVDKLGLGIAEWHKALAPAGDTTCVFRDSAFADDVAKTNLAAILEQNGIATVRSL